MADVFISYKREERAQEHRRQRRNHTTERDAKKQSVADCARSFGRPAFTMTSRDNGIDADAHHFANRNDEPDPEDRCRRRRQ